MGRWNSKPPPPSLPTTRLDLEAGPRFVSRGGEKLEAALINFQVNVTGSACADVGSSTGGFTDCLLQHGAIRVYAIDVGKGILHWKLRSDPRLVVMEETNARYVEKLPEQVDLVTIDASFISLKVLLPVVKGWLKTPLSDCQTYPPDIGGKIPPTTEKSEGVIALIKPQFEAGHALTARSKGVIRDPEIHKSVLSDIMTFAQKKEFCVRGLMRSPLLGPKGNVEFLVWLGMGEGSAVNIPGLVEEVMA